MNWPGMSPEMKALVERKWPAEGSPDGADWNTKSVIEEITEFMQVMAWIQLLPLASWKELIGNPETMEHLDRLGSFQNLPLLKEFLEHLKADGRFVAFLDQAIELRKALEAK